MIKHKHLITLHDRVQPVCDRYHCASSELGLDQLLNPLLRDNVDVRCCLIENHNLVLPQNGPADANQLPLTGAQVGTSLADLEINAFAALLVILTASEGTVLL